MREQAEGPAQWYEHIAQGCDDRPDDVQQYDLAEADQADRAITGIERQGPMLPDGLQCAALPPRPLTAEVAERFRGLRPDHRLGHEPHGIRTPALAKEPVELYHKFQILTHCTKAVSANLDNGITPKQPE